MKIFQKPPAYDFIGKRLMYFALSAVLIGLSTFFLATKGINWGIDFTGGSVVRLDFEKNPVTLIELRSMLKESGYSSAIPQRISQGLAESNSFQIRVKTTESETADTAELFVTELIKIVGADRFTVESKEFVGPTVGRHLYKQAVFAVLFSMIAIVVYVAFRFSNPLWGVAGILALAHDVFCILGLIAATGKEFDLILVAALLTTAGYSINDSIVIFDRMREKLRVMRRETLSEVLNVSINETLSRTLITSMTTLFTALTLALLGGSVIHDFAVCLVVGVAIGTYSSIGICGSLVFQWTNRPALTAAAPRTEGGKSGQQPARKKGKRARRRRSA